MAEELNSMQIFWDYPQFVVDHDPELVDLQVISLDATIESDLDWKKADVSRPFLYELAFGWNNFSSPFSCPQQFQTLKIACEHFMDLIWSKNDEHTFGVILYRGNLLVPEKTKDESYFTNKSTWKNTHKKADDHLFDRNVIQEYLALLAEHLPSVPCFALVDTTGVNPLVSQQLIDRVAWKGVHPIAKEQIGWQPLVWQGDQVVVCDIEKAPEKAFLLPSSYNVSEAFQQRVQEQQEPCRFIPEQNLVAEWQGVDHLLVDKRLSDSLVQRMLDGFSAAGGEYQFLPEK